MNNKGFTLIELLATLVMLALVVGISIATLNINLDDSKESSEEVFVDTIRDALEMYLSSDAKNLEYVEFLKDDGNKCTISKRYGNVEVKKAVYKIDEDTERNINFNDVINSRYKPITENDLVNPGNKEVGCGNPNDIEVNIYRDSDYVYYYSINKSEFADEYGSSCLLNTDVSSGHKTVISNLPEGFDCD